VRESINKLNNIEHSISPELEKLLATTLEQLGETEGE